MISSRFFQTWTICLSIEDSEKFPNLWNHSAEEFFYFILFFGLNPFIFNFSPLICTAKFIWQFREATSTASGCLPGPGNKIQPWIFTWSFLHIITPCILILYCCLNTEELALVLDLSSSAVLNQLQLFKFTICCHSFNKYQSNAYFTSDNFLCLSK